MKTSFCALLTLELLLFCTLGQAEESPPPRLTFNIQAQSLEDALNQFAKQAGVQLLYQSHMALDQAAPSVVGTLTPQEGLERLLANSGLHYEFINQRTVTIRSATTKPIAGASSGATPLHLAQSATSPSLQGGEDAQRADEASSDQETNVPEILVKGSRITNVDVKRSRDDAQPYYILDSKMIEQSGATNVEDFLKQRLTMDTTIQSNSQGYFVGLGTTSTINLRGLGSNETLILIDGRRSAGVSYEGNANQPDINGIPLSAIERIEVLPSSASAIYGGAAMGGVINIILKKNYKGGELNYTYAGTFEGHAPLRTVNATYGFSLGDGKTQVMLSGHYSDGEALLTGDRIGLVEQGYSAILKNDPGFFTSDPSSPILGATPNIGSADGITNLTLKSTGASLNSPIATIASGASAATPSSIIAGQWNYTLAPTAEQNGLLTAMGSVPRVKSLMATVHRELSSAIELFTEFSTESNIGVSSFDPISTGGGVRVPSSSPANPFNQDVYVSFPNTLTTPLLTDSVTQSVTLGLLARLSGDWKSELDYTWSRNSFKDAYDLSGGDSTAFNSALAAGTVNPFVDTLAYPLNLTPYLTPVTYAVLSTLNDLGLRASGPVGSLPWGRPSLTIGLEHRKEGSRDSNLYTVNPLTPANDYHFLYFGQSQSTDSLYAEAGIPLVTAKNVLPLIRSLDLQLAGRSEKYTVNAGTPYAYLSPARFLRFNPPQGIHKTIQYTSTNPTIGLKYKPVDDLIFRVSYAKAFLPPTQAQLLPNPAPTTFTTNITDPQNGQTYGAHLIQGGNPNLQPQTAKDWDLGVIWEPQEEVLKGLRIDLEYYKITQPDYITTPAPQQVVSNPAYASRVTRDPASGRITVVDVSFLNATQFRTNGWDLTMDYRKPTILGTFDLYALGTVIEHDRRQYTIGGPSLDYVGFPSEGGEGKTKATLTFSWEYRQWTLGWTTIYYGNYQQFGSPGGPFALQNGPFTYYTDAQGGYTIPSQTYHAIFGSYAFGKSPVSLLSNLTIQFGIKNLFNTLPPVDAAYAPYYYSPYGDPRLRDYWISLRKGFD